MSLKPKQNLKNTQLKEARELRNSIHFVLNKPSHPGNIGACARAMKVMGFKNLELIAPDDFPNPKAKAMATHGKDILEQTKVYANIAEALGNKNVVFALSARNRDLNWPHLDARKAAEKIWQYAKSGNQVAILFGREDSGLSNQDLAKSNYLVHILSEPQSSSLNLAQALQIVAYELFTQKAESEALLQKFSMDEPLATQKEVEHLLSHLNQVLEVTDFLLNKPAIQLKIRLSRVFQKAKLDSQEANLLRGIFASIVRYQNNKKISATKQTKDGLKH